MQTKGTPRVLPVSSVIAKVDIQRLERIAMGSYQPSVCHNRIYEFGMIFINPEQRLPRHLLHHKRKSIARTTTFGRPGSPAEISRTFDKCLKKSIYMDSILQFERNHLVIYQIRGL